MHTDLSTITDPKELKALAYDEIANKEQAERNLAAINNRLVEVINGAVDAAAEPKLAPSVSDEDLGIEKDSAEPSDGIE
jgi:hypothetical protein